MSANRWPQFEQPQEKLLHVGANSLSNAELLTLLFRTDNHKQQKALMRSRSLLAHFKGLQGIFQASYQQLCHHPGIDLAKYAQLHAAHELVNRFLQEPLQHQALPNSLTQLKHYLLAELKAYKQEIFACLFLDSHYRLIRFEKLFIGTHNMAPVYPREVSKKALEYNCSAVIAVHNHPSGVTTPSTEDQKITRHIAQSLNLFGIELLDHFIIAGNQSLSFKEQALL